MPFSSFSGGWRMRVALAAALFVEPEILLLDEPTNHLDIATIEWLEEKLKSWRGALVMISHDRTFLNNLTNTTFWLDRGKVRRLDKGFSEFDTWSSTILEQETAERAKLDKLIEKETDWSHKGITARRKRNMGRMRNLWELREKRSEQIAITGTVKLATDSGKSSGKKVIEARKVSIAFDDQPILDDFSVKILRGDRVGIIGPNGAGKTTLLKILTGAIEPDNGTVKLGTNLEATFLDQHRSLIKDTDTVWETLSDGSDHIMVRGHPKHIISYIKDFLFEASQAHSPVSSLSGGEKNRLLLAKTLAQPTNLLILDEPTNDLDTETLAALEEALENYAGCAVVISHDGARAFQQVPCTGVVPKASPSRHDLGVFGVCKVSDRGPKCRELDKIVFDGRNSRLLQHNLGHPDEVGVRYNSRRSVCGRHPPRHIPRVNIVPIQQFSA